MCCDASTVRETGARTKFLSCEPLLGALSALNPDGIDLGDSRGRKRPRQARPMDAEWVREIRDICLDKEVAFHFKQWGGPVKSKTGRVLDGRKWDDMPSPVRIATNL